MKRLILAAAAMAVLAPLVFAQTGPEQQFLDWSKLPITIDPNQVVTDPASGQPLLLNWRYAEVGQAAVVDCNWTDPEGNSVAISVNDPAKYLLAVNAAARTFRITFTPPAVGLHYVQITASDTPLPGLVPQTRRGTYVFAAVPPNKPPVLRCGGLSQ